MSGVYAHNGAGWVRTGAIGTVVVPPPVDPPPVDPPPTTPSTGMVGWLRTPQNTGLASMGHSAATIASWPLYTGPEVITSRVYRQRIVGNSNSIWLGNNGLIEECDVSGNVPRLMNLAGSNQHILNSDIRHTGAYAAELFGIYGGSYNFGNGTYGKGFKMTNVRQSGGTIGLWLDGADPNDDAVIDGWLLHNLYTGAGGQHRDGFTRRDGNGPLTIKNSRIDFNAPSTTGAVFIQAWDYGPSSMVGHITLEDSYFGSETFTLYIQHGNNIIVRRNRIRVAGYGPATSDRVTAGTWTANYIYSHTPANDYKGSLVPSPF